MTKNYEGEKYKREVRFSERKIKKKLVFKKEILDDHRKWYLEETIEGLAWSKAQRKRLKNIRFNQNAAVVRGV